MRSLLRPLTAVGTVLSSATALAVAVAPTGSANADLTPLSLRNGLVVPGTPATCSTSTAAAKYEMRGEWIATVANMDWPSRTGLTVTQQKAELVGRLNQARARGYNTVVLQVRPSSDTFWPSKLEPWSAYLTGTQGKDPGWDPMAFAVTEAHARGLQLHAWMNPYRVANTTSLTGLASTNVARVHPDWTVTYGGRRYLNPGLPAVRQHVVALVTEVVKTYAVDAVHFDDYFYPYPVAGQTFDDAAAYKAYGAGQTLAAWRRANVTTLITQVGAAVHAARPGTQFGVSPFGVWRNAGTDPSGSTTTAGVQSYDDLYADTRAWAQQGLVDYLAPQDYWSRTLKAANYDLVAGWWANVALASPRTNIYLGEATYKVGVATEYGSDTAWTRASELPSHMTAVDEVNSRRPSMKASGGAIKGHIFFSASDVAANRLGSTATISSQRYAHPALTPRTPWLDSTAPSASQVVRSGTTLHFTGAPDATRFVVYRVPASARNVTACQLADMRYAVAVTTSRSFTDPHLADRPQRYTWLVSAVDHASNESAARLVR